MPGGNERMFVVANRALMRSSIREQALLYAGELHYVMASTQSVVRFAAPPAAQECHSRQQVGCRACVPLVRAA